VKTHKEERKGWERRPHGDGPSRLHKPGAAQRAPTRAIPDGRMLQPTTDSGENNLTHAGANLEKQSSLFPAGFLSKKDALPADEALSRSPEAPSRCNFP
jgi:hypothetical protein